MPGGRKDIPKNDEEALQDLLDDIEALVREEYWNGEWSQSGATVKYHSSKFRGNK